MQRIPYGRCAEIRRRGASTPTRAGVNAGRPPKGKNAPDEAGGVLAKFRMQRENSGSLRLGSGRLRRGLRGFCRRRLRRSGSCRRLDRVGLIIKADNVLRDVDLRGGIENGSALRRGIQNDGITVFTRVTVQHVHHLAADAVDDVGLRGIDVFLVFGVHAVEALRAPLTLLPEAGLFFLAQLVRAGLKTLLQITDLLVQTLDLVLTGSELRLQLRGSQLALRRGNDSLSNVDDADLARCGRTSRGGCLCPSGRDAKNARGGQSSCTSQHTS